MSHSMTIQIQNYILMQPFCEQHKRRPAITYGKVMASSNFVQNYHHRVKSFELFDCKQREKYIFANVVHDEKTEYYAN